MNNKTYMLNTVLAAVVGVALAAAVLVRTFLPLVIMPVANIPNLVGISVVALVLDHYLAPNAKRCYICIPLFGALTFGLLPFAACFVGAVDALWMGISGGAVFTVTTFLYTSIQDRLSTGPNAKLAPVISALGLFLASQAFVNIIL